MSGRISTRARYLRKELFLERNHDLSRTALVLGSGRSGTTWLAESIARQHRSRLLFEPFHPQLGAIREGARLFLDPTENPSVFERSVRRILSGRVRGAYIDEIRIARLPRGRIVKDVHAANLLPWLRTNHPAVPVVYVVRHPIAASLSRLRSDTFYGIGDYLATPPGREDAEDSPVAAWLPLYDTYRDHPEPLVRLVAEWCIENVYPLRGSDDAGGALTFYENAVLDPVSELTRLGELCAGALGPARVPPKIGQLRRPSAMDWRRTAAEAHRSGEWERLLGSWTSEVPGPVVERCLSILSDFGLDRLYGEGPLPIREAPASPRSDRPS
ncbi:MAG TPA: hypothetical protein VIE64_03310 [Solirubrobacterales bacterium]|jgi:hypothetical protein